jgi:Holliday junction resolvasome, endonuclease subunit
MLKEKSKILGIDPGLSGALALFDPFAETLEVIDMPVVEIKAKRYIDNVSLSKWLDERKAGVAVAMIEQVHSMPGQGVSSTFAFGRAFGSVEGAVVANGIVLSSVTPAIWKACMGVTADKNTSRARASQILPKYAESWKLKKHDGRAEAALIAVYAAANVFFEIKRLNDGQP